MKPSQQSDVIDQAPKHLKPYGKNFKPLVAAGSWEITGFRYGKSKCACCGRPIYHTLQLTNKSHKDASERDPNYPFTETIEIGVVCGPKVFTQSCVGFYNDPEREWDRQIRAWRDYINYVVLCVKHEALWKLVPVDLRQAVDDFLEKGYKAQDHSGGWWMVRDGKKRFLRSQRSLQTVPEPRILYSASRALVSAAKRQGLVPLHWELRCDIQTGEFSLEKEGSLAQKVCA